MNITSAFGRLAFTTAVTNGYPLGEPVATYLQTDDLTVNSKVQIKTTTSASNKEAFTTVFA